MLKKWREYFKQGSSSAAVNVLTFFFVFQQERKSMEASSNQGNQSTGTGLITESPSAQFAGTPMGEEKAASAPPSFTFNVP